MVKTNIPPATTNDYTVEYWLTIGNKQNSQLAFKENTGKIPKKQTNFSKLQQHLETTKLAEIGKLFIKFEGMTLVFPFEFQKKIQNSNKRTIIT